MPSKDYGRCCPVCYEAGLPWTPTLMRCPNPRQVCPVSIFYIR